MTHETSVDDSASREPGAPRTSDQGPFYISATGPSSRQRHTMKHGDTFAVLDSHGDFGAAPGGSDGLFNHDTRFLSRFELLINGTEPLLLGSSMRDDNVSLSVDLTNADIFRGGAIVLPKDTIHIIRTTYLWGGVAHQRINLSNHGDEPRNLTLNLRFDCDFSDLFEVRGTRRAERGIVEQTIEGDQRAVFTYRGLDGKLRKTVIFVDRKPSRLVPTGATFDLTLRKGTAFTLFVSAECYGDDKPANTTFPRGLVSANRNQKALTLGMATVDTSNDILNEVMCRSTADIYMLLTDTLQGPYPYAGIPWYSTTFGRDGIITAMQMLWCDPQIAKGVLGRLAAFQATANDAVSDAEPGKILHEMRGGEMAALHEVPFGLYYGSVDSTPLFIVLAGLYVDRTADVDTLRQLWPAIENAFGWMDGPGDRDGDGFLEYERADAKGLQNQGWKDSFDAVYHADGTLAEGPIALVEVQGYAYAARRHGAACARRLGFEDRARRLDEQADKLAETFDEAFWCEDIRTYAIALDGKKKPCRVRTSNAGQVLWTGLARPERARAIAGDMLKPGFFSGWGIRTVAQGQARYNPMSYHDGSIWPHDNALIALGLARYGFVGHAEKVFEGLFAAAAYMDLRRLPELFCGFRRRRGAGPTLYPVACSPQAWAAASPFMLLQAVLGIELDPEAHAIRFRNPRLPSFCQQITLRRLGFADAFVDLTLLRMEGHVAIRVLRNHGAVQVSVTFG